MHRALLPLALLCASQGPALSQVLPGQFIATVNVGSTTARTGEVYVGDVVTRSVTQLTIAPALQVGVNAVIMTSPVTGYLSTIPVPGPTGDIYSFTVVGNTLTETQRNTAPMPGTNISQLAVHGGNLYWTSQTAANDTGLLGRIPLAGGPPTVAVDFSAVPGYAGLANALAIQGDKAYVGSFDSSATGPLPQIWEVDLLTGVTVKILDLPKSRMGTGTSNSGPVNLQMDPARPGILVAQGVYGDYYVVDVAARSLVAHLWTGTRPATGNPTSRTLNSFFIDVRSGDFLTGTRDGFVDLFVRTHNAGRWIAGLGSSATPSQNSVTGLWYSSQTTGEYKAFGDGCPGSGGHTPTSFGLGVPIAGSTTFGFGVASGTGGGLGLLLVGASNTSYGGLPLPFDLAPLGLPGCSLRVSILLAFPLTLSGSGGAAGVGQAVLPVSVPLGASGAVGYTQWIAFDHLLALDAVSDGRRFAIP